MSSLFELTAWDFVALVALVFVVINIIRQRFFRREEMPPPVPQLPDMPKQDFYTNELEEYDGRREDGRLLLACDGKVFDVSVARAKYGKDGPYNSLVGRDASRALATFDLGAPKSTEYDDLSDLGAAELEGMREWARDFEARYTVVGRLLKPGEPRGVYDNNATESTKDK